VRRIVSVQWQVSAIRSQHGAKALSDYHVVLASELLLLEVPWVALVGTVRYR
jgi:hypothetical protein